MKPLNKKAKRITPKEEIIAPRLIPRKPLDQTSLTNNIKFSIFSYGYVSNRLIL
jgi:hypothetical protein